MRNAILFLAALLLTACSETTCVCPKGHEDYVGHCPCKASDCECPVRIQKIELDGEMVIDIWGKDDPLTVGDTLYIRARSEDFFIKSLMYGYYIETLDFDSANEQLIKLLLPEGHFSISISIAEKETRSTIKSTIILSNIVVNK